MDLITVVENLSPDMYQRFLCAAETGKWPDGVTVEQAQRETAMQIVMAYQSRVLKSEQNMTIGAKGEVVQKSKAELKQQFKNASSQHSQAVVDDPLAPVATIARFSNL